MNQLWPAEFGLANVRTVIYHVLFGTCTFTISSSDGSPDMQVEYLPGLCSSSIHD